MILGASVKTAQRSMPHSFTVIPQRWVVERSFVQFEKRQRLWKNCERKLHTSQQMVVLAFVSEAFQFKGFLVPLGFPEHLLVEAERIEPASCKSGKRFCTLFRWFKFYINIIT
jgi:hypothetical protein